MTNDLPVIDGKQTVLFKSTTQRKCYIHSEDGYYLNGKAKWIPRPVHLAYEWSWPDESAALEFLRSLAKPTGAPPQLDDYVAWCRYTNKTIVTCDSDAKGAFKVYRRSQWIPVTERLPTHVYSVVIWCVDNAGIGMLDAGIYNSVKRQWQAGHRQPDGSVDDEVVNVTHWFDPEWPAPTDSFREGDQSTPGEFMQGIRTNKQPHELEPGEYAMYVRDSDAARYFHARTPNGLLANLAAHTVTEHEDGTITVAPSILTENGEGGMKWHGYLERGVWREC